MVHVRLVVWLECCFLSIGIKFLGCNFYITHRCIDFPDRRYVVLSHRCTEKIQWQRYILVSDRVFLIVVGIDLSLSSWPISVSLAVSALAAVQNSENRPTNSVWYSYLSRP